MDESPQIFADDTRCGRADDKPARNTQHLRESSATRWSQVRQAARGDESGHIGTRRLKPGGVGRGTNGAPVSS